MPSLWDIMNLGMIVIKFESQGSSKIRARRASDWSTSKGTRTSIKDHEHLWLHKMVKTVKNKLKFIQPSVSQPRPTWPSKAHWE